MTVSSHALARKTIGVPCPFRASRLLHWSPHVQWSSPGQSGAWMSTFPYSVRSTPGFPKKPRRSSRQRDPPREKSHEQGREELQVRPRGSELPCRDRIPARAHQGRDEKKREGGRQRDAGGDERNEERDRSARAERGDRPDQHRGGDGPHAELAQGIAHPDVEPPRADDRADQHAEEKPGPDVGDLFDKPLAAVPPLPHPPFTAPSASTPRGRGRRRSRAAPRPCRRR